MPPNNGQKTVPYSLVAKCGTSEVIGSITALPYPERPNPVSGPAPPPPCGSGYTGKPVDLATGEECYAKTDLQLAGPFGLNFTRYYGNQHIGNNYLGANWQDNYDAHLDTSQIGSGTIAFYDGVGLPHYFSGLVAGGAGAYDNIGALTLSLNTGNTLYTLTDFSSDQWTFDASGYLASLSDRYGNVQTVNRDLTAGRAERIGSVVDPLGRELCFYYDSQNRIIETAWQASGSCPASAPASGTMVKIAYDSGPNCATGDLCSVTEPDGRTWKYQYDTTNALFPTNLTGVFDPLGDPEEVDVYGAIVPNTSWAYGAWVVQQYSGNCGAPPPCSGTGADLSFTYSPNASPVTTVLDGEGRTTTAIYDPNSLLLTDIVGPLCYCGGNQHRTYTYDSSDRMLTQSDDAVDASMLHNIAYTYGRDSSTQAYPGPTKIVENLDTAGTTRTTLIGYYPVTDPRQDLPETTSIPSVDTPGKQVVTTDTYASNGTLTGRQKAGYINGVLTPYSWSWTYDKRGRMLQYTGPRALTPAESTKASYFSDTDADHVRAGQLSGFTDPFGHSMKYSTFTGFTSYTPFGEPESLIDRNGVATAFGFDAWGRLQTSTLQGVSGDTSALKTVYAYDSAGRVVAVAEPLGNQLGLHYDSSDRLEYAYRENAAGVQYERMGLVHNANDQITSRTASSCTTPAVSCAAWSSAWSMTYAFSATTSDLTSITNADGTTRSLSYIDSGGIATLNDERHTTGSDYTYTYDLANRRLAETRVLGPGSISTKYSFDVHDNLTSITDANGNVTKYSFDDFDRLTKQVSPVEGTTTYGYDADSNLTSKTDANGSATTYTFDQLNRPLTETAKKGAVTLATIWTYDDPTSGHFGMGRLSTMTDPSGSSAFTYERRGHVAVVNRTIVGQPFTQAYAYDGNANQATVTYPDGYVTTTSYDFADRPVASAHTSTLTASQLAALAASGLPAPVHTAIPEVRKRSGEPLSPRPVVVGARKSARSEFPSKSRAFGKRARAVSGDSFVTAATYEPFGPLSSLTFGNGTAQALSWTTRYLPNENKLSATSVLADYSYAEDQVGNITGIVDKVNAAFNRTFGFDDLNRLTTANSGTSLWGTATGNGYSYDLMGNLTALKLGATRSDMFKYEPGATGSVGLPELATVTENGTSRSVSYDSAGNELADGVSTFGYSPRELLGSDSAFVAAYYYDGFHQRVATQIKSNSEFRDSFFDQSLDLIAETAQFASGSPSIAYKYVWFGDRPVAEVSSAGTDWIFADQMGTPLIMTDSTAAIAWQAEYEPYGNIWAVRTGASEHQPLRLPGQSSEQFDTGNNGLSERSFNNARWYRPSWGRYTQPDPLGVRKPSSLTNLYEYAKDEPTIVEDPSGKGPPFYCPVGDPWCPLDQIPAPNLPTFPLGAPMTSACAGGHCGPAYGNYCGQFRTNGKDMNQSKLLPTDIGPSKTHPANPSPIDGTDGCCVTHDQCHAFCDGFYKCLKSQHGSCNCSCDKAGGACILSQQPGSAGQAAANTVFGPILAGHGLACRN